MLLVPKMSAQQRCWTLSAALCVDAMPCSQASRTSRSTVHTHRHPHKKK